MLGYDRFTHHDFADGLPRNVVRWVRVSLRSQRGKGRPFYVPLLVDSRNLRG